MMCSVFMRSIYPHCSYLLTYIPWWIAVAGCYSPNALPTTFRAFSTNSSPEFHVVLSLLLFAV